MSDVPLIVELSPPPDPVDTLARFRDWPRPVFFHSASHPPRLGRYSFLSADPVSTVDIRQRELLEIADANPNAPARTQAVFQRARDALTRFHSPSHPSSFIPHPSPPSLPFSGGVAGVLNYEAGRLWEKSPAMAPSEEIAISFGVYDWVLAWDHATRQAWIIVQPLDELRGGDSAARLAAIREILEGPAIPRGSVPGPKAVRDDATPFSRVPGLVSNFDRETYQQAVARIVRYIHAGDIFQANLSQRFSAPAVMPAIDLFRRLTVVNPAPFAGYYDAGDFQVVSASPERFLRVSGNEVETRPIKGTRARRPGVEADLFTRDELRESEKDRAENVMIVDLLRNDLSRVCRPGSIRVPQLCTVETYETVQHLVSEVRGTLRPGQDFFDLLAATFPGGSITGAPKIRAMEIISELEQVRRGPYCGTLFYSGFNGEADSSILIRTFTQSGGRLTFPAGGGITAQSDPAAEYQETLHKVEGLVRAIESTGT